MTGRVFIDSNILIYAHTNDRRAQRAQAVMLNAHVISVQVLNEFANVARRKLDRTPSEIREATVRLRAILEILPITLETHDSALSLCERYAFSFFDALIVAAALEAGCTTLYTDDLQHGQIIEKHMRIVNPFV